MDLSRSSLAVVLLACWGLVGRRARTGRVELDADKDGRLIYMHRVFDILKFMLCGKHILIRPNVAFRNDREGKYPIVFC